ncbi:FAD-dependent oxidoreductase [Salinarimonas ramus]|uniref:Pyridine nucleotide-disulfide oxidoreductase n=1 Tax=Salinarimonas ramus TaxID=690164 RepID=A0A917QAZ2_9HYPH|nr:FAD-dependent oxidoreductase [Salinarimonas ramus]GGK41455.1 pyridine nucleotide-disulfide oxidoreductase [Salinarimonas ramus]
MTKLVLVGGGHSHALVLDALRKRPEPGIALTLVSPAETSPYSGMLPGHVAGLYAREAMHIDVRRLVEEAGGRFVLGAAERIDRDAREVVLGDGAHVPYDLVSLDIGITPDLSRIPGAREHAIAVKPIGDLLAKIDRLISAVREPDGPRDVVVVGGGAAGLCLAFALARRLRAEARSEQGPTLTIVTAHALLPELNGRARRIARARLAQASIALVENDRVARVEPEAVILASGRTIASRATLVAVGAAPPPLVARSGLAADARGFLAVDATLRSVGDPRVFAAGDCAGSVTDPRPKAGVFAVRQGPILAENLRRAVRGEPLVPYSPQTNWLVLMSTADGRAIAARGRHLALEGRLVWWLKDRIDRRFVQGLA